MCLALFAGAGMAFNCGQRLCTRCIIKACEDGEQKITKPEGGQERVAGWHFEHVDVLATFMILADISISLTLTREGLRE